MKNSEHVLDSYSYHEALDRTFVQLNNLENALGEHPVILSKKRARELYESAVDSLAELYQELGRISLGNDDTE